LPFLKSVILPIGRVSMSKILIVDDEKDIVDLIAYNLEKE
jgi:hypothetical protein